MFARIRSREVQNIETNAFDPLHLNKGRGAVLLVSFIASGLISDQAFEKACGIELR